MIYMEVCIPAENNVETEPKYVVVRVITLDTGYLC
jgi:hypothetical protein